MDLFLLAPQFGSSAAATSLHKPNIVIPPPTPHNPPPAKPALQAQSRGGSRQVAARRDGMGKRGPFPTKAAQFTWCFLSLLPLRSLSPPFGHSREARHTGKKMLGCALLVCSYFTNKGGRNECLHPKEIPVPFPHLHHPKQSTKPAALQSYLDAETVWDRDRGVPRRHGLLKASLFSQFSLKTPH